MSDKNFNIPSDVLNMMKELMDMGAVGFGGFVDEKGKMYPITLGQMPNFAKANHNQHIDDYDEDEPCSCDCENCDFDCGGCDCDGCNCDCNDEEECFDCDEMPKPIPNHTANPKFIPANVYLMEDDSYVARFECGCFAKEDIEISYEKNTVTVTVVSSEQHTLPKNASNVIKRILCEEFKLAERATRSVTLPDADFEKANAEYKNGVLTLVIPKKAKPEPSRINIT